MFPAFTDPSAVHDLPTLGDLLRQGAERHPDRPLATFEGGTTWTWSEALGLAQGAAQILQDQGVGRGDRVALFMENSAELLQVWWGASLIGAVIAPMNPAYKGQILEHACRRADARTVVTTPDRLDLLETLGVPATPAKQFAGVTAERLEVADPPRPWDPHALIFTSGTTGHSKASISTFAHLVAVASWLIPGAGLTERDTYLVDLPLFHLSALSPLLSFMAVGGRIAVRRQPAMSNYWATAKELGVTGALVVGTMAQYLMSQPESDSDRDHDLRFVLASPLPADPDAFVRRFGLQGLVTAYGSTEANIVVNQPLDVPVRPGSCGKLRPEFEVRLVDEHDFPVAPGEVGEAIVRCPVPWLMSQGYQGDPDATVTAWRNGWFHTGDALRCDEDGYYFFHDRFKDALRRRGENISSFEVEREVLAFPGVAEVACVAEPSPLGGDDEVKVFLVCEPEAEVDLETLVEFLVDRMPYFMVPRYYERIESLPRTPTARVQKHLLRAKGNSEATWDREAAGLFVTRQGLKRK